MRKQGFDQIQPVQTIYQLPQYEQDSRLYLFPTILIERDGWKLFIAPIALFIWKAYTAYWCMVLKYKYYVD